MLANVSSHEAAVMNETFSKIWAEVRNSVTAGDDENWIGLSRGVGVTKEDLTSAAESPREATGMESTWCVLFMNPDLIL